MSESEANDPRAVSSMVQPRAPTSRELATRLGALAIAPGLSALGVIASPLVAVPDELADPLAVVLAVAPALTTLALACRAPHPRARVLLAVLLGSVMGLVAVSLSGLSMLLVPLQTGALVAAGYALGTLVGSRVAHPGHMLPAAIVASAADLASVLSPEGPSHAIASSETALSVAALAAPVPGTVAVTHVLGVGDLIMLALFLATGSRFGASTTRICVGAVLGLVVAFVASAMLRAPIPALVPISLTVVALEPRFRSLAPADRRAAALSAVLAVGVVAAVLARR
jgi:hypothetical protein